MVRTIEREDYIDLVKDKSVLEEHAESKISDSRLIDAAISDENATTAHGLSSGRTIKEKLADHKHGSKRDASSDTGLGEHRTETELHGMIEPERPVEDKTIAEIAGNTSRDMPNVTKTKRGKTDRKKRQTVEEHIPSAQQTGNVSTKYNSALRGVEDRPKTHMQSSTFKGGQIREGLSDTGKADSQKSDPKKPVKTDKYGNIIPTRISSKAKGTEETKARNISKTKNLQKDTLEKKINSSTSASGRFQSKIGAGTKTNRKSKVKTAVITGATYKVTENTDQNATTEAVRAGIGSGYLMYSRFNRRRNNLNAQKFLYKARNNKTSKGNPIGVKRVSGKYGHKASKSFTQTQEGQRKAQAVKRAQQVRQAKKFRLAKAKEKELVFTFEEVKQTAIKVAKKLVEFARAHATVAISVTTMLVAFIAVSAGLGSCAMALSSGSETYVSGMSGALDPDMTDCDNYFTEKEMLLQEEIDNITEDYPDFDEYVFDVDEIGHDSIKLMAYLSAVFDSYDLSVVQDTLDEIFDEMYELTLDAKTETRVIEVLNPDTGEYEEEEVEVEVLYVTLKKKDWDEVIESRFPDDSSKERYEIYDDTDGAHQAFYNPFTIDWSEKITSRFG